MITGVFFSAITRYASVVVNLLVTIILARLISPSDFGVVAIAMVFSTFFNMLSEAGIGPAVIQTRHLDGGNLRSLFTFTIFLGLFLTVLFYFSSNPISSFYSDKTLESIIKILSISVLFRCASIVPLNLLMKEKRFKTIAVYTLYSHILCGVIAIGCAYGGMGVYSLLVVPVLGSALLFGSYYKNYRIIPTLNPNLQPLKKIFYYSLYQFLFTVVNYFSRNFDKLVVGKVFGSENLGYYEKSYRLMMMPVGYLSNVISSVVQPIFAEYQDNKEWLAKKSLKIIEILALIGFPLSVLLYMSSTEVIITIFGNQWYGAVPAFKILSISIGFQMIYSPQGAFFQSANATKLMFYNGMITAALNISSVLFGCFLFNSLSILCYGIVISYIVVFLVTYYFMCRYVFEIPFLRFLKTFNHSLSISGVLLLLIWLSDLFYDTHVLLIKLMIKFSLFCVVLLMFEYYKPTIRDFRKASGGVN